MSQAQLNTEQARAMLLHVADRMIENHDLLTQADKAIGDGDHGIGMARGFAAVQKKLEEQEFNTIGQLFSTVGTALLSSIGGAAGAVFGTMFRAAGKSAGEEEILSAGVLAAMLRDGLEAVKTRGGAKLGDKTMVDALEPAVAAAEAAAKEDLSQALAAIATASREGMEHTKNLVAGIGKARSLGDRALGHADPGALSTYLIFEYMAEYANKE